MRKNHNKIVCIKLVHLPYFGYRCLGYIGIVQHKEHSPEVSHILPGTPCRSRKHSGEIYNLSLTGTMFVLNVFV